MPSGEEAAIRQLLNDMAAAWGRGDAQAFGARYRDDGTFTNVFGTLHVGRDEFIRRHADVFQGFLKDTRIEFNIAKLNFVRPDTAIADIDMVYPVFPAPPRGVQPMADGLVHSALLMVLVKDGGEWWVAAYHNIWRAAAG